MEGGFIAFLIPVQVSTIVRSEVTMQKNLEVGYIVMILHQISDIVSSDALLPAYLLTEYLKIHWHDYSKLSQSDNFCKTKEN